MGEELPLQEREAIDDRGTPLVGGSWHADPVDSQERLLLLKRRAAWYIHIMRLSHLINHEEVVR